MATLRKMVGLICCYSSTPQVRTVALDVIREVPARDDLGIAKAILEFVQKIPFRNDVLNVETLQSPMYTIKHLGGDCDDRTILICCLLRALGYESAFMPIGQGPIGYDHVLPLAGMRRNGKNIWVPMESIRPDLPLGYSTPHMKRHKLVRFA